MAGFDGNGVFTRVFTSWQSHADAGIGIEPKLHDDEDDNFSAAFNKAFCRDGQAAATGDFDMDAHLIHNLGMALLDGDAVSLGQVTASGGYPPLVYKKGPEISGADLNGRLNFSSSTGVNGIGWNGADLAWVAKIFKANETRNRLVLNDKYAADGADVVVLDDEGNIGCASLTYNLSHDTDGDWRAINPGWASRLYWTNTGGLNLQAIDTATTVDNFVNVMTKLRDAVKIETHDGNTILRLHAMETGTHSVDIIGGKGTESRWAVTLGTAHAETGGDSGFGGSHLYVTAYNNSGAGGYTPFYIMRDTGKLGIPYGVSTSLTVDGVVYLGSVLSVTGSNNLIMGGNNVYFRPNGALNATNEMLLLTTGMLRVMGIHERSGSNGSYGSQVHNSLYGAANDLRWYVGTNTGGPVGYYTPACDYRIKRDVRPLPSSWDAVKALRPVIFKRAAFGDGTVFKDDDNDDVGFLAHELQEALGPHAATGVKDWMEDDTETLEDGTTRVVRHPTAQGPNVMAVVAAVTAALQEAMVRIEKLEVAA